MTMTREQGEPRLPRKARFVNLSIERRLRPWWLRRDLSHQVRGYSLDVAMTIVRVRRFSARYHSGEQ
jgi:hypothetical protein